MLNEKVDKRIAGLKKTLGKICFEIKIVIVNGLIIIIIDYPINKSKHERMPMCKNPHISVLFVKVWFIELIFAFLHIKHE